MKVEEVLECSLPHWYPSFEKVTFPTVCLSLPNNVLDYLREDGQLVLPKECNKESYDGKEEDYDEFGDTDWDNDDSDVNEQKSFPKFSEQVLEVIKNFGGEVFIKLNWSSPKDATWVSFNNSVKCTGLSQLYLLLKSSDFIAHDLTMPFHHCEDTQDTTLDFTYSLVLRKWFEVNPGTEFRCWISDGKVIAICQRDVSNFYPHIFKEEINIKQDLTSFFQEQIHSRFKLNQYVIDLIRPKKDKVLLVDFNPWGETTDSILFSYEELDSLRARSSGTQFKYIKESNGVQPHPYRHYSIPRDMVDLASGTDPYKLIDFLKLKEKTENGEDDSDPE